MFGRKFLIAGNGLLRERLSDSGGYLGRKVFMRSTVDHDGARREKIHMGPMIRFAAILATLLVIRMELNPGPVENTVQVLCSGCYRILKLGTQFVWPMVS
jgi:hypothetical protein